MLNHVSVKNFGCCSVAWRCSNCSWGECWGKTGGTFKYAVVTCRGLTALSEQKSDSINHFWDRSTESVQALLIFNFIKHPVVECSLFISFNHLSYFHCLLTWNLLIAWQKTHFTYDSVKFCYFLSYHVMSQHFMLILCCYSIASALWYLNVWFVLQIFYSA